MAKRSDFPTEEDWLEWNGEIGDFDARATEIIRSQDEEQVKSEIRVSAKEFQSDIRDFISDISSVIFARQQKEMVFQ